MKKVSVITVNYNQTTVTEALLRSLTVKNRYENTEIIVIDNGSKDNPISLWENRYPNIRFIRSETNRGFAGGNNLGISEAKGDYLFFINNDTEVTPGLIPTLVNTMESHPEVGMISPKIRYFHAPDIIQYAGFTPMNYFTCRNLCIGQFEKDEGQYDKQKGPTGFVHGAAMMLPRAVVDKVGPMPENFFLYYEEMDWCEKVKKAGYPIWFDPEAVIYHKESVSVGQKSPLKEYFMNRNRILFIRRNAPGTAQFFFYLHFCLAVTPRNLFNYVRDGNYRLVKSLFTAIWWNLAHPTNSNELGYPINQI